jgi:hypothetical protein
VGRGPRAALAAVDARAASAWVVRCVLPRPLWKRPLHRPGWCAECCIGPGGARAVSANTVRFEMAVSAGNLLTLPNHRQHSSFQRSRGHPVGLSAVRGHRRRVERTTGQPLRRRRRTSRHQMCRGRSAVCKSRCCGACCIGLGGATRLVTSETRRGPAPCSWMEFSQSHGPRPSNHRMTAERWGRVGLVDGQW